MPPPDLLPQVDALIRLLETGGDPRPACQLLLTLLDEDPSLEAASVPSVSMASLEVEPVDGDGTWLPDDDGATVGLGLTVGTWAPEPAARATPRDLRGICTALLEGTTDHPEALQALRAWRELRRPPARYVLGPSLGSGGMGDVVQARDEALDRHIALKVLRKTTARARRSFIAEAKLTARLQHPGIVPVHDVGETPDGRPYFAMKQVQGRSLRQVLEAGELPGRRARLDVFRRVCQTVAFAHDRGVLHLDLKPDNVMVGPFGEVLVMDWGLAREVSDGGATLRRVAGTPRYMAPEQATRGHRLDVRADVYSLGALLYELVCDAPAFRGTDVTQILEEVRAGAFRRPRQIDPSLPRELEELLLRAMARDPDDRLASVGQLLAEIEAYLEDRELSTVSYSPAERLRKWTRRNQPLVRGAVATGVVAALGLAIATGLYMARVTEARAEAERQARQARIALAEGQLVVGQARALDGFFRSATGAYQRALDTFVALGIDPTRAQLGLAEVAMWQPEPTTLTLDAEVRGLELGPGGDLWFGGERAGVLDVDRGEVRWLGTAAQVTRVDGLPAFVVEREGQLAVIDADGAEVRRMPLRPPFAVAHGVAWSSEQERAFDLATGEALEVAWEMCEGEDHKLSWPLGTCGGNTTYEMYDARTGELISDAMLAEVHPRRGLALDLAQLRPVVVDLFDHRETVWAADDGPWHASGANDEEIVWVGKDGRATSRRWQTGQVTQRFDLGPDPCVDGVTASSDLGLMAVVCRRDETTELSVYEQAGEPAARHGVHAVAASVAGRLHTRVSEGGLEVVGPGQTWRLAVAGDVRDAAFAADGRLAAVSREPSELHVVEPGATGRSWPMTSPGVGVAWASDGSLAVVDRGGTLYELHDGALEVVAELPSAWGVAPLRGGWVVTHPRGRAMASWVRGGEVVATAEAAQGRAGYDVAAAPGGEAVVFATSAGGTRWDGDDMVDLPGPTAIGATWGPTGPVLGSMDSSLRFYTPAGELLHRWRLPDPPTSLASYVGGLFARTTDEQLDLPYGDPPAHDPIAEAWEAAPP